MRGVRFLFLVDLAGRFSFLPTHVYRDRYHLNSEDWNRLGVFPVVMSVRVPRGVCPDVLQGICYRWAFRHYDC